MNDPSRHCATKILIALSVAGLTWNPLRAAPFVDQQLAYNVSFGNGSLDSSVDKIGLGALQTGDTQVAKTNPSWTSRNGALEVGITRPPNYVGGIVGAGVFATPVSFDKGSVFALHATFVAPLGPHASGNTWAITVEARTGTAPDLLAETRIAATLQIRADGARLNVPGASAPANLQNIPQALYDAIFDPTNPEPFTLELLVDRKTGDGTATLKIGETVVSHNFQFAVFRQESGPPITAVGPSIAISNAPGQRVSVQVRDFRIYLPRSVHPDSAAAGCSPGWGEFNCRVAPAD